MREFCRSLTTEEKEEEEEEEELFLRLTVAELVERQVCPAWYLASQPVLGRCLPVLQNNSEDLVSGQSEYKSHQSGLTWLDLTINHLCSFY